MATISIGGSAVEYLDQGCGEPVVLLHSTGSSSAQWRRLADALSVRHRVLAPDLYGYGATAQWPGLGAFCLDHEAAIVGAVLARAGEPAHVVGHSYGGAVALHVARERSDLMRSLTVIEPVAFHLLRDGDATDERAFGEISAVAEMVARSLACGDYLGGFGRFVDYWSGPDGWQSIPAAKRPALAARLGKVALDFHATFNAPARPRDLCMLAVPTLVLRGSASPLPTRRICDLLANQLPDAEMRTLDGAGHMLPLTHSEPVNSLIAAHIERCTAVIH